MRGAEVDRRGSPGPGRRTSTSAERASTDADRAAAVGQPRAPPVDASRRSRAVAPRRWPVTVGRRSERVADQEVEQLGVRRPGGGEHPRHLRVLGEAGHRVDLVEHRPVLGQEEVDPGDARRSRARRTSRRAAASSAVALAVVERGRDAEVGTPAVLRRRSRRAPRRRSPAPVRPPGAPSGRPSTATSISRPTTTSSTRTRSSSASAASRAPGRARSARATRVTPRLDPAATGFTTTGCVQAYAVAVGRRRAATPGRGGDPERPGDQLGRPLVHRERAGADPGADVRHPGELAEGRQRPVLAARAVHTGNATSQDREHVDRRGEAERARRLVAPPAVRVDGEPDDVVGRRLERVGDRGRRGERDVVLAVLRRRR